ncbi:hypothetical protein LDENG_00181980, partial [Lucifuga dentata]
KGKTVFFKIQSIVHLVYSIHKTSDHACLSLMTIISQRIKPYFSFPDSFQNLLLFQNQILKRYTHLKNQCFTC